MKKLLLVTILLFSVLSDAQNIEIKDLETRVSNNYCQNVLLKYGRLSWIEDEVEKLQKLYDQAKQDNDSEAQESLGRLIENGWDMIGALTDELSDHQSETIATFSYETEQPKVLDMYDFFAEYGMWTFSMNSPVTLTTDERVILRPGNIGFALKGFDICFPFQKDKTIEQLVTERFQQLMSKQMKGTAE